MEEEAALRQHGDDFVMRQPEEKKRCQFGLRYTRVAPSCCAFSLLPTSGYIIARIDKRFVALQIINKRTLSLWRPQPALKPEPNSLHLGTIHHPLSKRRGIRALLLPDLAVARWCWYVFPDAPPAADLLVNAEHVVVQQVGAFGMGSIFEDGTGLGPGDELALFWDSGAGCVGGPVPRCEARDGSAICSVKEGARGGSAADPAGILGDEGIEPFDAVLLNAAEDKSVVVGADWYQGGLT